MLTEQIFLQLIVILLTVQVFGYLSRRIGQQWVIGEILAGIALGPSLFGAFWPALQTQVFPASSLPTLQTLGDIGLALYMFSLGARLETNLLLRQSRRAMLIALGCTLFPFVVGAALALALYPAFAGPGTTLFPFLVLVGSAMAITAFPVLARLLAERQMLGTKVGMLSLTSASIGDVIAWYLLALVVATAHAQGFFPITLTVGLTLLFVGVMLLGIRPLLNYLAGRFPSPPLQIALSFLLLLLSAYLTSKIGIHPVFGAFLAGVILPRNTTFAELARCIDLVNASLLLPLFFIISGLRTQVGLLHSPSLWLLCLLILVAACLGKILAGTLLLRVLGESWRESFSLGTLMNTRGLVELILLNIGLDLHILSPTLFAMLVIMAIATTMMTSPILSLLGYRLEKKPTAPDETIRQVAP